MFCRLHGINVIYSLEKGGHAWPESCPFKAANASKEISARKEKLNAMRSNIDQSEQAVLAMRLLEQLKTCEACARRVAALGIGERVADKPIDDLGLIQLANAAKAMQEVRQ